MLNSSKQSQGGKARAKNLSDEERSSIASSAAKARWAKESSDPLPEATHQGVLQIGEVSIPCAVLKDGSRVISEHGITTALGSRSGASKRLKAGNEQLPIFLAPSQLKSHIPTDLEYNVLQPIVYKGGRRHVIGYKAEILPIICDIWLRAREAGSLQKQQLGKAQNAEILLRGLAKVGIIALIDEATGYQYTREKDELHKILAAYLSEERLAWAKMFPDEFYKQIYRLKKWPWPNGVRRSPLLGKITNIVVYDRLPPGVLEALQKRNPTQQGTGRRKWRHHQFLSEDFGQPDLRDHLLQVIAIMRISPNWSVFMQHLKRAFPKYGDQLELNVF
jgi:hypothetical protein